jgi:GntR family transcriptional repressor for pyruvate dehydrogenase complex
LLGVVNTLTISEAVAEKVLELISEGKLVWGQRLPSQRELAGILKVSVSSLREGLQILQATGYIEVKRGQGTYISASPERPLTRNISRLINIDANVKNLMGAREILEVGIAELAAEHADKDNLHGMRQSLMKLEKAVQENDPLSSRYDLEFHLALAESSHNPILLKLSSALRSSMEEFISEIDQTKKGVSCHWKVFKAIEKKDAVYAGRAMRALLNMTEHEYLRHLSKGKKSERSERSE